MIDVPESVKQLFKQDSISKNFRVKFVNGEYRDLVNADFVSESVAFTESVVSSSNEFKLGIGESSTIEFRTYFTDIAIGMEIFCCIEIDISSLSDREIQEIGITTDDVPYPFYRVPYGYFIIDSADITGASNIVSVVGYNDVRLTDMSSKYFVFPKILFQLCRWGLTSYEYGEEPGNVKLSVHSIIDAIAPRANIIYRSEVTTYNSDSTVFVRTQDEYRYFPGETIPPEKFHYLTTPAIKNIWCPCWHPVGNTSLDYVYVSVRGKEIYFQSPENTRTYSRQVICDNANGFDLIDSFENESADLNYVLQFKGEDVYAKSNFAVSWKNSITMEDIRNRLNEIRIAIGEVSERFNEATPTYYPKSLDSFTEGIMNNIALLDWMISPCIKFDDCSKQYSSFTRMTEYSSRNAVSSADEMTYQNSSGQSDILDKIIGCQRLLNVSPIKKEQIGGLSSEIRDEIVMYSDMPQFMGKGQNGDYKHREYNSPSTYWWNNNQLVLCIPTEIVFAIPNEDKLIDTQAKPYKVSGQHAFDFYTCQVNEFSYPRVEEFRVFESEQFNALSISLPTSLTKWIDPDTTSTEYDSEKVYFDNTARETRYVYSVNENTLDSMFSMDNLRSIASAYAELRGKFLKYSRTKQYTLETVSPSSGLLLPSVDLYPSAYVYPCGADDVLSRSDYYKLMFTNTHIFRYDKLKYVHRYVRSNEEISLLVEYVVNSQYSELADSITKSYDLTDNYLLNNRNLNNQNSAWSQSTEFGLFDKLHEALSNIIHHSVKATTQGLPYLEASDYVQFLSLNSGALAYILRHRISGIQSLKDEIEA